MKNEDWQATLANVLMTTTKGTGKNHDHDNGYGNDKVEESRAALNHKRPAGTSVAVVSPSTSPARKRRAGDEQYGTIICLTRDDSIESEDVVIVDSDKDRDTDICLVRDDSIESQDVVDLDSLEDSQDVVEVIDLFQLEDDGPVP